VVVKVVKNKVAPPFKQAEFDIIFGEGISKESIILDYGVEAGVIEKLGSWFNYKDIKLGQGRENARIFLKEHKDIFDEIENTLKSRLQIFTKPDKDEGDESV